MMTERRNRTCTSQDTRANADSAVRSILQSCRASALIAGSSLVFAPFMVAHAAGPAETPAASQASAESDSSLEEIVVTARRKGEVLQDIPVTVTAVTATELQKLNLQNLKDISGVVPGLQIVAGQPLP